MRWKLALATASVMMGMTASPGLFGVFSLQAQQNQTSSDSSDRANNQRFVIGGGIGTHGFSEPLKAETEAGDLTVSAALLSQVYGEWYYLDALGFGIRYISFGAKQTQSSSVTVGPTTSTVDREVAVDMNTLLATIHWIPLGGQSYARLGVLGGIGLASYQVTAKVSPGGSDNSSTSGPAALLGAYIDWGGEGFGARFGGQYLVTQLEEVKGETVTGSGTEFYLDFRWAF